MFNLIVSVYVIGYLVFAAVTLGLDWALYLTDKARYTLYPTLVYGGFLCLLCEAYQAIDIVVRWMFC